MGYRQQRSALKTNIHKARTQPGVPFLWRLYINLAENLGGNYNMSYHYELPPPVYSMWRRWDIFQKKVRNFNSQVYGIGDEGDFASLTGSRDLGMACQRLTNCLTQPSRRPDLGWQVTWLGEHYDLIRKKFGFTNLSYAAKWNELYEDWKRLKPDLCTLCEQLEIDLPIHTQYHLDKKWLPQDYRLSPMQKEEPVYANLRGPGMSHTSNSIGSSSTSVQSHRGYANLSLSSGRSRPTTEPTRNTTLGCSSMSHTPALQSPFQPELSYPVEDGPVPPEGPTSLPAQGYSRTEEPTHDYYRDPEWYTNLWSGVSEGIGTAIQIPVLGKIHKDLQSMDMRLKTLIRHVEEDWMDEKCLETAERVQKAMNHIDATTQLNPEVMPSWLLIRKPLYYIREEFLKSYYERDRREMKLMSGGPPPTYSAVASSFEKTLELGDTSSVFS
jgi:hypothetical protein